MTVVKEIKKLEIEEEDETWELLFSDDNEDYTEYDFDEDGVFDEHEEITKDKNRYIILVIYDIVDNKKRLKMVKCLERYGIRVQKSCFEAYITKSLYENLKKDCSGIIDEVTDSLRIYMLTDFKMVQSWGLGDKHIEDVIIF